MENINRPDLHNKVVVITGACGVLCSEFSKALALCGAKVALLNRTLSKAEDLAQNIVSCGGKAFPFHIDVCDKESVRLAHDAVNKEFGPCDILINGAGGNNPNATTDCEYFSQEIMDEPSKKSFFDLSPEAFFNVFGLNIMGTVIPTQEFAKDMVKKQSGNIINISSMNAYTPLTKIPAYSAAKAGVTNFTQWLAVHFSRCGIRANAIAPGFFSTAQNAALLWNKDGSPTARTGKIIAATPMGRFGKPEELIGTLYYLVDEKSSGFVTGIIIPVDGGFSAYSGV